jgi:L-ascorbate metabolism protein UlaG (beta-lactamase superfamily)
LDLDALPSMADNQPELTYGLGQAGYRIKTANNQHIVIDPMDSWRAKSPCRIQKRPFRSG